jgi:FMN phosphatase YigB (HAD superfamily)
MTRPEAIVFDLGKVLVDFDYGLAAQRLAERSDMDALQVRELIEGSPAHRLFEAGHMDRGRFFETVARATGFTGTLDDFSGAFADIFTPIEAMIDLHQRFNALGYPTYIFSNTNEIAVAHIRLHFPFFSHFTAYIYSFEHHSMKPDASLYEVVEAVSGCSGQDILYLDDRPENAASGAARHWQVIHHQFPQDTLDRCRAMNLL